MSKKTPQLPKCPSAEDLQRTTHKWSEESQKFLQFVQEHVDDAEIFIRHQSMRGWRFEEMQLKAMNSPIQGECYIRLFKGGHTMWGRFPLHPPTWQHGVRELIKAFPKEHVGIYRPPIPQVQHPRPHTFDSRVHDYLGDPLRFQRLAHAMSDNTWHEGERLPGIQSVRGKINIHIQHRMIFNRQGFITDSKVHLEGGIQINHYLEDERKQIFAPNSFLPWALMGAHLWRKRAHLKHLTNPHIGFRVILLSPRVLEKVLRHRLPFVCTHKHFEPQAQIANPQFNLTHEPNIDGMVATSPFDDLGKAYVNTPMIVHGALQQPFTIDPLYAEWSPQGPRAYLSNFFIRPGERSRAELLQQDPQVIQIENAQLEPIQGNKGPNFFSLRLTEAITSQGALIAPNQYKLSGSIASTLEGSGLLESVQLSREVFDTGTAVLPYALCTLYLHPL
jgi:hypothetical protein